MKNIKNLNLKKSSQIQRTNWWLPEGEGRGGKNGFFLKDFFSFGYSLLWVTRGPRL